MSESIAATRIRFGAGEEAVLDAYDRSLGSQLWLHAAVIALAHAVLGVVNVSTYAPPLGTRFAATAAVTALVCLAAAGWLRQNGCATRRVEWVAFAFIAVIFANASVVVHAFPESAESVLPLGLVAGAVALLRRGPFAAVVACYAASIALVVLLHPEREWANPAITLACWGALAVPLHLVRRRAASQVEFLRSANAEHRRELAESEELYRIVSDNTAEVVALLDDELRVTHVNSRSMDVLGIPPEAFVGTSALAWVFEEDREFAQLRMNSLRAQQEAPGPVLRVRHADGTTRWLEVAGRTVDAPDIGPSARFVLTARDITSTRQTQERLRMLARAVDQTLDGVAVSDLTGRIEFVNAAWARMHGHEDPERLAGVSWERFHDARQRAAQQAPFARKIWENGHHAGEVEHTRSDGTRFPVWIAASLLRDEMGKPIGVVSNARDLTGFRDLDDRIREAQKHESLSAMAAGIAHDFNNLLAVMLGEADLARDELPPNHRVRGPLGEIVEAGERAALLTGRLLTYAGGAVADVRVLDFGAHVREIAGLMRTLLPANVRFDLVVAADAAAVRADPGQLQQVVMNVILNARDALSAGDSRIEVRVDGCRLSEEEARLLHPAQERPAGAFVRLRVSDNGEGIDPGQRTRIFDPFFSTRGTGRGLGLATAAGIVRAHGGGLQIDSQPGFGTRVEVYLPACEDAVPRASEAPARGLEGSGHVLVVDDEASVRRLVAAAVERMGFAPLEAATGEEACELQRKHAASVRFAIIDMTMPGLDGPQTLAALREITPALPALISSGYTEQDARQRLGAHEHLRFLAKPFTLDRLREQARTLLGDTGSA